MSQAVHWTAASPAYVFTGHTAQSVPSSGAYVPALHSISVVALGHTEPNVHARQEMGEVVRLFWMKPTAHWLHPRGDDCPGDDFPLLLHWRTVN
jgi:hypothetical protein